MDLGYWTAYAETWFQARLDRIRCHDARVKNASQWRDDLKRAHSAKKLRAMTDQAATTFFVNHGREVLSR